NRRRKGGAEGDHHARAPNGSKPDLGVAQLCEILDRVTIANVPGDRREIHSTDHGQSLIAPVRPDSVEPLEDELKVVAHAAVENRERALAGLRDQSVAAAG